MNIALYSLQSVYPYHVISKVMLNKTSMSLFVDLYWYIVILFYQKNCEKIIKKLDHNIAFLYVKMEGTKIYKKDYFLKVYI